MASGDRESSYRGSVAEAELVPGMEILATSAMSPCWLRERPVFLSRYRAQSASGPKALQEPVDIVISTMVFNITLWAVCGDRYGRRIEGLGNGFLLPAGPLREPPARLASADIRVRRGGQASAGEYSVTAALGSARNLVSGEEASLDEFRDVALVALAGIRRPERFFGLLRQRGLKISAHPFPDHHQFCADDIPAEATVLMTEKDAVKCVRFASDRCWSVAQITEIPWELVDELESVIHQRGKSI